MIATEEYNKEFFHHNYIKGVLGEGDMVRLLKEPYRIINYYYPIEGIFDEVNMLSSVIGKHTVDKEGKNMLDRIAMTKDEKPMFMKFLRESADDVYVKLSAYVSNNYKAYYFDEKEQEGNFEKSIHYIVQKPEWVLENSVKITDGLIKDCLVTYVMFKWMQMVYAEQAERYYEEYRVKANKLRLSLGSVKNMQVISHPM